MQCLQKIRCVKITEKQAIYLINAVLILRILYHLNSCYLTDTQLKKITKAYLNIVRHKVQIAKSILSTFLFHPNIYALKSITQQQKSHLNKNLVKQLNSLDFDRSTLKIRLQYLQDAAVSNQSILSDTHVFLIQQKKSYIAHTIIAMYDMQIQMLRPKN